jgi:hypothetical protein
MGGGLIVRDENAGGPYHAYKSLSGSNLSDFDVTVVFHKMIPKLKKEKQRTLAVNYRPKQLWVPSTFLTVFQFFLERIMLKSTIFISQLLYNADVEYLYQSQSILIYILFIYFLTMTD